MWEYFSKSKRCTFLPSVLRLKGNVCADPHPQSPTLFHSDAFDFEYGTVVLRMSEGLDVSHIVEAEGKSENLGST